MRQGSGKNVRLVELEAEARYARDLYRGTGVRPAIDQPTAPPRARASIAVGGRSAGSGRPTGPKRPLKLLADDRTRAEFLALMEQHLATLAD